MESFVDSYLSYSKGLTCAVSALLPTSDKFLDVNDLKPLTQLLKQDRHDDVEKYIADEALITSRFLKNKFQPGYSLQEMMDFMLDYKDAFPTLNWHYSAAMTLGISIATCKNSFYCLTRVLQPQRRSMSHERKSKLVLLAFEKSLCKAIDMDTFLQKVSIQPRRILL